MATCSTLSTAAPSQELIAKAESGDTRAQVAAAIAYQGESQLKQSHYWLIQAALKQDDEAIFLLGQMFENAKQAGPNSLSFAENWYSIGSDNLYPASEQGYARVLETQFNNRRAKQVSSISALDDQIDQDIADSPSNLNPITGHSANKVATEALFTVTLFVLFWVVIAIKRFIKIKRNKKAAQITTRLSNQSKQIKILQRHLSAAQSQLANNQKQLKKDNLDQSMTIACAILGFHPSSIPSEHEIKVRYKKLSRIYHPDVSGNEEDMKRLNAAVKVVGSYLKQKRR
jgi:TPR repeat protein